MQRKVGTVIAVLIVTILLIWFGLLLRPTNISVSSMYMLIPTSSLTAASPFISNSAGGPQATNGFDPAILAALIGLAGLIVSGCIAGAFALYSVHRTAQIEKQRQEDQRRYEQQRQEDQRRYEQQRQEDQRRYEQQKQDWQFQRDQEKARLEKELEEQYKSKEQAKQSEAAKAEALRVKMVLAQTNDERAKAYRQALHADPRISRLQILDMSRPLEVTNIYVRLRVHQDVRASYELDPAISAAQTQRDPNVLLQVGFKQLERRASNAIDPNEAIRIYTRCVIVGDPGAGKTTLLKYLTLKSAEKKLDKLPDLPIRIELNAFASSGYHDLLDFASAEWDERYGFPKVDARAYIEEKLQGGNALLLLDALDETVIGETTEIAEASYQRVADAIMQIATRYHQSPIVVTARKAGYQQRAQLIGFTELEVLEFRLEDMQLFVTNWFECYQDPQKRANAIDLNVKLENAPRMQALASNPLLLSLIVLVYEAELDLPDRRAELYKRCVDTLLTEWDAKRNIRRRREFKPEHKRQLLAEIAWHFHPQGLRYFPESEVLLVIANFLPKVRLQSEQNGQVLAEIANEHGLLKEQARGWQGFLHLTLQEYFVAQYVTDRQQLETLLVHRGDPWWEEVFVLYAGHTPDASKLLRKLLRLDDEGQLREDVFQTNLILAGRCLAARPKIEDPSLWETVIVQLFDTLRATPYSLTQALIADALAAIGGEEVNKHLLQLLSNVQIDLNVREHIAEALGRSGEYAVVPELVQLLSNKQVELSVRERIAEALGRSGESLIVPRLVRFLSDKQVDLSVRERIADSLGILGERSVAPELVQLLSNKQIDLSVREHIAEAMGTLGERSVAPELVQLLSNKQIDLSVREHIALALGTLGEHSVAPELMQMLSNKQIDLSVGERIAVALGTLGEHSIAPELVQLLSNKRIDLSVRECIAVGLGTLGEHSVTPELMQLLTDEKVNVFVRGRIAEALGKLGKHSVAPELVQLLSDEKVNESVRERIAEALGILGELSIVPDLLVLLSNEQISVAVRGRTAVALGMLGERSVLPELTQLLSNEQISVAVRGRIVEALGKLGKHSVAPELVQLLSDKQVDSGVRERISEAINNLGERSPELLRLLSNKQIELSLRGRIAEALGRSEEHSFVPELMQLLFDEQVDSDVRGRIAEALGTLVNDEATIRDLAALLSTSDIANQIHHALWTASRRIGVRIFFDNPKGKQPEVVKW